MNNEMDSGKRTEAIEKKKEFQSVMEEESLDNFSMTKKMFFFFFLGNGKYGFWNTLPLSLLSK